MGKELREPCTNKCRMKCYEKCTKDQRLKLFHEYYALANIECQWQYIAHHIDKSVPKARERYRVRKYNTKASQEPIEVKRNRANNIRYYLDIENERLRVCQIMFLATYDLHREVIKTVARKTNDEGILIVGMRGRKKSEAAVAEWTHIHRLGK